MHAIIRRYDGVDQSRTVELTAKVNETLIPKLEKLTGFEGFYLIEAGNGGTAFNINGGFHLHLYGANADGSEPADSRMGSHSNNQGKWYIEDKNPSVHAAGTSQYQAIGTMPKICARIAQGGHRLVTDANGTFKTGNCVTITRA